jgi:hypothetical protein
MGWGHGFDDRLNRDIGYGVPAICDHPDCNEEIDRGISYVCGGEPYGGENGCGLHFCSGHLYYDYGREDDDYDYYDDSQDEEAIENNDLDDLRSCQLCLACLHFEKPYNPKPDVPEWIEWKLTDESWQEWRDENPELVLNMKAFLKNNGK